jgi:nitroreductase
VITDAEKRAAIGEYYRRSVASYLESPGAAGRLHADDPDRSPVQQRVGSSVAYLGDKMGQVPVLVIPCLQVKSLGAGNQAGLWGSILPAAWQYCLAARARGLGTAWTTLHMTYEQEISELLGLPEDIRQSVLLPTAYYTGDTFKPAPRQPVDEVLHIDGW